MKNLRSYTEYEEAFRRAQEDLTPENLKKLAELSQYYQKLEAIPKYNETRIEELTRIAQGAYSRAVHFSRINNRELPDFPEIDFSAATSVLHLDYLMRTNSEALLKLRKYETTSDN